MIFEEDTIRFENRPEILKVNPNSRETMQNVKLLNAHNIYSGTFVGQLSTCTGTMCRPQIIDPEITVDGNIIDLNQISANTDKISQINNQITSFEDKINTRFSEVDDKIKANSDKILSVDTSVNKFVSELDAEISTLSSQISSMAISADYIDGHLTIAQGGVQRLDLDCNDFVRHTRFLSSVVVDKNRLVFTFNNGDIITSDISIIDKKDTILSANIIKILSEKISDVRTEISLNTIDIGNNSTRIDDVCIDIDKLYNRTERIESNMISSGSNVSNLINDAGYIQSSNISVCLSSGNEIHILNDGKSIAYVDCSPILTCIGDPVTSAFLDTQNNIHIRLASGIQHIVDINPVLQNTNSRLAELEGQNYAYKTDLDSYYNKDYVDNKFMLKGNYLSASDISGYATEEFVKTHVNEQITGLAKNTDLTAYYTKDDIDNAGFLTEHQSLDNLVTKDELAEIQIQLTSYVHSEDLSIFYTKDDIDNAGYLTSHQSLTSLVTNERFDELQNSLTSFVEETKLTAYYVKDVVDNKFMAKGNYLSVTDIEGYATEQFVENSLDELTSVFVEKSELTSQYYTKEDIDNAGFLTEHQSLDSLATKDDISYVQSQLTGYADITQLTSYYTKDYIDNAGFLTSHQSLDNLATVDDVNRIEKSLTSFVQESQLTAYCTKDYVDSSIQQIEIPSLDQYVTTDQLTAYTNDLINSDVLSAYALSSDVPTITYDGNTIHDLIIRNISKQQLDQQLQSGQGFLSNEILIVDDNDYQGTVISSNDGIISNLIITKLSQQEFYDKILAGEEFLSNEITIVDHYPSLNLYGNTIKNLSVDDNPDDYDAVNKKYVDDKIATSITGYCTSADVRQIISQVMTDEINSILNEPM